MRKKIKGLSALLMVAALSSCTSPKTYPLEEYVRNVDYKEGFTVCCFNDCHLSVLSDLDVEFEYYESVLKSREKFNGNTSLPDMIVLNGDTFMDANKEVVDRFFKWIATTNIPFLFTYGNHDLQGPYGQYYIDTWLKKTPNCLNVNPLDDDIFGNCNSVVNVKEGDDVVWQVYGIDSNTYNGFGYDVVHDDQIKWYKNEVNLATSNNGGTVVPSLAFMHVPCEEFKEAWTTIGGGSKSGSKDDSVWYMGEGVSKGYRDNDLVETMLDLGSTKGLMTAHDHINNTDWHYTKEGHQNSIRLVFGTKTGQGIYHDKRVMGASFYTLNKGATDFELLRLNVQYDGTVKEMNDEYIASLGGNK